MKVLWKTLNILEESVLVAGMAIMILFNFLNVVFRYLLPQTPFSYTEELVVLVFIWISMFGISYGYRMGSHTVLTIISDSVPRKVQRMIAVFATLASAVLMVVIAYTGYNMVMNQIRFGQILPGMGIPMPVVSWAIPAGAVMSFMSILKSGFGEVFCPEKGN